jgi:hypothetical protein
VYAYSYALEKSNKNSSASGKETKKIGRKKSDGLKEKDKLSLEKTHSYEPSLNSNNTFEKITNSTGSSIYQQKSPKIITKNQNPNYNANSEINQNSLIETPSTSNINDSLHSLNINQPAYVPKKIITKEKTNFNSNLNFKTNPDGAKIREEIKFVSNEKTATNVSEYRSNRVFQNEKLTRNQVYYYDKTAEQNYSQEMRTNKNILFKGNK